MEQKINRHWEVLSESCGVYVNKFHHFTTDTLLLAQFSKPRHGDICADFGTGCGAIPILWQSMGMTKECWGVEIQKDAADMAQESVNKNKLQERIKVICGDIKNHRDFLKHQSFDKISCNPPYKAAGAGIKNPEEALRIARHEDALTPEVLAQAAKYCLKFSGALYVCQRPERLTDYMTVLRSHGVEPKRLQIVQQSKKKHPSLFLLEARRGGNPGLHILPALMVDEWEGYNMI